MSFFRELTKDEFDNRQLRQVVKDLKIENKKLKRINHDLTRLMAEDRKTMFEQYKSIENYVDYLNIKTYPIDPFTYGMSVSQDKLVIMEKFELNKFLRRYIRTKILPAIENRLIKAFCK